MQTITRRELYDLLNQKNAGTPVGVYTITEPKMRKTGNPYIGNCVRLAHRNGFIGVEYANVSTNRINKPEYADIYDEMVAKGKVDENGRYVPGPLPWGQHDGRYFITHKGKIYLKYYPQRTLEDRWETKDGLPLDKAEIEPFLYGSADKPVAWRTVALDNIVQINVAGEQYQLTG